VNGFLIGPSSARVVYLADQETDELFELFSVPITGGTATKLSGTLVSEGDVYSWKISSDDSRVVYLADKQRDEQYELFVSFEFEGTPTYLPVILSGFTPTSE
jgi:hypothetical protein